jgi:hypothetical protein
VRLAVKMNRLARLAALARVAGQNLPSAITSEGQVRYLRTKNTVGCDHCTRVHLSWRVIICGLLIEKNQ